MADDTMRRRRELVARRFADRRDQLGLTQEKVAQRADVAVRTVANFESQGRWPNVRTRTRLERAVEWPPGEIARIADIAQHEQRRTLDAHTRRVLRAALPDDEDYRRVIGVLEGRLIVIEPGEGEDEPGRAAL